MKVYRIVITNKAENDIIDAINYISNELLNKESSSKLKIKLQEAVFTLKEMPQRNALLNDNYLKKVGYRKIIVDNYIIFYYISEKDKIVYIVRILYNRRNWIELLKN